MIQFTSDGVPDTPAHAVDHDPYEEYKIQGLLFDSGERPSPLIVNPTAGPGITTAAGSTTVFSSSSRVASPCCR